MFALWDTSAQRAAGRHSRVALAASSQSLERPPRLTASLVPLENTARVLEHHNQQVGDFTGFTLMITAPIALNMLQNS